MRVEDESVSEVIREKIALMHQKVAVLNTHWLEETRGVHLGPDGILLSPDGRPLHNLSWVNGRGAENIIHTTDGIQPHDMLVMDRRGAENGDVSRMETQMLSQTSGPWRSAADEWNHLEEELRKVSQR